MITKKVRFHLQTGGGGYWSDERRTVDVYKIAIDPEYRTLDVFFTKKSWDRTRHGLIYTDSKWLREFRKALLTLGFSKKACNSVDYTEQGLQGLDYVSLDFGHSFMKELIRWPNE